MEFPSRGQSSRGHLVGLLTVMVILVMDITKTGGSDVKEVCQAETFSPKCDREDEVVVIETAQYGRLELGECVTDVVFGHIGCVHDVMPEVESRCSGRRSCEIRVDDTSFKRAVPCHKDLKSHLWVSYQCIRVIQPLTPCRYQGHTVTIDPRTPSFVSSHVTEETGCGTADAPWVLEAGPGQRLNLTLLDFATELPSGESRVTPTPSATCRVYATIRENPDTRSVTVCGGQGRRQTVFVSSTNRIEIRFLPKGRNVPQFLLKYEVIGCSDPSLGEGTRMQRLADHVRIGCSNGELQWKLSCVDNQWNGYYENCSSQETLFSTGIAGGEATLPYATSVVIITVIAVAVVCLIMTSGVLCVKWRLRQDVSARYPVAHLRPGGSLSPDYDYGSAGPEKLRPIGGSLVPCNQPPPYSSHTDSSINANEYATMRLLQRAGIGPVDCTVGYGEESPRKGSTTYSYATDHIYESPETMRRLDQPRLGPAGVPVGGGGAPPAPSGPPGAPGQPGVRTCEEFGANHRYESPSREHQFQQRTLANATGNYSL